ncbi:MAG: hypothetical protein SFV53_01835 [Rickettsiales bacterium]|nr:hypothetical protein [Rickettsiales bacterium]
MKKLVLISLLIFLTPKVVFGAGAYLVDDGGIIDVKKIQIENWYSRGSKGENIFVTNPAYQLLPNAEFAVQETYDVSAKNINTLWPQIKYLWHNNKNISSSATLGINYSSTDQKIYGTYAYSSTTAKISSIIDSHFYVGWQNWRHSFANDKSINFLNYGVGFEMRLNEKLFLIPEIFQTNGAFKNGSKKPATQLGLRYFANDKFIFDAIYGHNINGRNQSWITLGVTLVF